MNYERNSPSLIVGKMCAIPLIPQDIINAALARSRGLILIRLNDAWISLMNIRIGKTRESSRSIGLMNVTFTRTLVILTG